MTAVALEPMALLLTYRQRDGIVDFVAGHVRAVTDAVRDAVERSTESRRAICAAVEIDPGQLSRFMAGTGGLGLDALDRLAAYLGLRVVQDRKKGRRSS